MDKINIGIIGCGAFAKAIHIPILQENPKFHICAVMDIDQEIAKETADQTNAEYFSTKADEVFNDDNINTVIITTRHDSHADLTIRAANAGKNILCEKPMALSSKECKNIYKAVEKNKVKYTVGYNRGMAPLATKAKLKLQSLSARKLIYHRIQAPFSADHWMHDPKIGGGRFVGEGCHIFDMLCELIAEEPVSVYASGGIFLDKEKVGIADSGIVTLTFADGSVGTTLVSSAGCPTFPKEATEIYCDGKVIHIEDFKEMTCYGFNGEDKTHFALDVQDKGWSIEIDQFGDSILNDTPSPNGIIQAAKAAVISYKVHESIEKNCVIKINKKDYVF